ncbi:putative YD repeat protein [Bacillus phage PBC1]|uniref:Putative YD repeat protein n=1 Tax=Bacillus phage PBC1 TaxID=1161901 RepID=I1TLF2_9CAUD|nr:virion structural protein [Bacillus phage PBC1]AFE86254.1 putative YD repeat protein [Bacillus phage PBC1]
MADNIKLGELLNERSPVSKTWVNFDGSYTVEMYNDTIHYKDENGQYKEIDPTLSKGNNSEYFQTSGVPFDVKVPQVFTSGYSISDGNEELTFIPVGASEASGLSNIDKLNEIIYLNVWQDTNVKLEVTANSLKETIILKSEKAPSTYLFEVLGELSDDLKTGRMQLSPAWLKDANGTYRDVEQKLEYVDETGSMYLSLDVDTANLVYPIYVDPTIVISNTTGVYGLENEVRLNSPSDVIPSPLSASIGYLDTYRIFMKYPNLLKTIPSNAQILSAKYNMHVESVSGSTNIRAAIHAVMTDYSSMSLSWNNQPVMDNTLKSPELSITPTANKWVSFDMKDVVQAMVNGAQVKAFGIKTPVADAPGCVFTMTYNDASNWRPYFDITFNVPPDKPTVVKPNGGEAWNNLETIQWGASNDTKDFVHEPFTHSYESVYQSSSSYGQSFTVPADNASLKKVALRLRVTHNTQVYKMFLSIAKPLNGTWVIDKSNIIASQDVNIPDGTNLQWVEMTLPDLKIAKGTHLAVWVEMKTGGSTDYTASISNGYFNQNEGNGIVNGFNAGSNFVYRLEYAAGTPTDQITYQIQLTSDNGSTWKTIVDSTPAGATSYPYDFTNEPESSVSKIRIRAFDGYNYGDWDESDGVFTIQHNVAPLTPTDLAPNGTIEDRGTSIRMSWKHNDPNGVDPQSKLDLQWRVQGSADWTTVTQSTTNQFYNAPANLFPANSKIEWRVRTYDQAGLAGPYSYTALFTAAVRSDKPTITYPTSGANVPIARPTFTWSHPDQVKYWIRVKDGSTIIYETQATAGNKALTITRDLNNNTSYILEISVMDSNGLWSDFANVAFVVSYTPPNIPVLSADLDNVRGWITLTIESADPTGTTPATTHYNVYRKADNGSWVKIADGLSKTSSRIQWIDRTPAPTKAEQYFVRAYGENGTFSDSGWLTATVQLKYTQISLASDPTQYVTLNKREASKEKATRRSVITEYVGRPYPMVEFSSNYSREFDYTYKVYTYSDVEKMRGFAFSGEALLLRDNWGRKDYVTFDTIDVQEGRIQWNITFHPVKIYYVEGIS